MDQHDEMIVAQRGDGAESLKEFDALVQAAERHVSHYDGDDRQDIRIDVLNAFYAGAWFAARRSGVIVPHIDAQSDNAAGQREP